MLRPTNMSAAEYQATYGKRGKKRVVNPLMGKGGEEQPRKIWRATDVRVSTNDLTTGQMHRTDIYSLDRLMKELIHLRDSCKARGVQLQIGGNIGIVGRRVDDKTWSEMLPESDEIHEVTEPKPDIR